MESEAAERTGATEARLRCTRAAERSPTAMAYSNSAHHSVCGCSAPPARQRNGAVWPCALVPTMGVQHACQQPCKFCACCTRKTSWAGCEIRAHAGYNIIQSLQSMLACIVYGGMPFSSERYVGPTHRGNGKTSRGKRVAFGTCPCTIPFHSEGGEVRMSRREQLAEAMHRIDALLVDMDDVRRSSAEDAASATERADASEARLKCASDCRSTRSCRIPCKAFSKPLSCSRPSVLLKLGSCSC